MSDQDRLAEIKVQRAALADDHTCLNLDWLPSIDWLIGEVERLRDEVERDRAARQATKAGGAR